MASHVIDGGCHMCLDLQKPFQLAQELKSNLKSNTNDTLMHYSETSSMWL